MTEPSVEEIVARWEAGFPYSNYGDPAVKDIRALIASWRKQRAVLLLLQEALPDEVRDLGFRGRIAAALKDKP